MKRRTFLLTGLGSAGVLLVGWGLLPPRSRLGGADLLPVEEGEVGLNGWIKIAADGRVMLAMNRSEMGQGVHTALAMLVAAGIGVPIPEELPVVGAGVWVGSSPEYGPLRWLILPVCILGGLWVLGSLYSWALEPATAPPEPEPDVSTSTDLEPVSQAN